MITVENLTKSYGRSRGIIDISFSVSKGEVIGFLGPNGAGKTTTMKILTGYFAPDWGKVSVAGIDILKEPLRAKKITGYLPENTPLYQEMEVYEYLDYVAQLRLIPRAKRRGKLYSVIERCGLKDVVHRDIQELSKGYKQRVGIAQALVHDPDIVILDEPTTGLDPSQIIEIRNLIKTLGQEKTIILSTHILPEVSATCNRVIIINNGKIVASGTPRELSRYSSSGTVIQTRFKGNLPAFLSIMSKRFGENFTIEQKNTRRPGWIMIKIHLPQENVQGEEIFSIVAQNNWQLSELKSHEMTLEDIFLNLTQENEKEE